MTIALIDRVGFEVDAIDVFCGYGGSSQGIHAAGATVRVAANHSELALECHAMNFPETEHLQADLVSATDPQVLNRNGKKVSGRYVDPKDLPRARFAWFSPACFPAGTLVLTKRGLTPIEDVVIGDEAWTHMNRWRPVTATMTRRSPTVIVSGNGNRVLEVTPNHRFWARRDAESRKHQPYRDGPAKCLWCGNSAPPALGHPTKVRWYCSRQCNQNAANWRAWHRIGERVDVEAKDLTGSWWATPVGLDDVAMPRTPDGVDWWWLGRWLGDGWVANGEVIICCGRDEADELASRLPSWRRHERRTATEFALGSEETARWLTENFGKGAAEKHIPSWVLALPPCDTRAILAGYVSADGHVDGRGQVSCATVSKALAHGIRLLAISLGLSASVGRTARKPSVVIEGRTCNQRDSWRVIWYEDTVKRAKTRRVEEHLWARVDRVVPGRDEVDVFNITVDEDHTYVADGIVVHNCTHHSQANAKKIYLKGLQRALWDDDDWEDQAYVNSERSRVTMSCVLRYAAHNHPEIIAVENVVEVTKWGPKRDGTTFLWWMNELRKLGYEVQLCWFNSMFFGPCPQSRDRLYIVAHRKGNKAPDLDYRPTAYCTSNRCSGRIVEARQTWKPRTSAWVTKTWGKYGKQYGYRCPECRAIVHPASWMALSAIDLTNLGPTLGERIASGKAPAPNTWERIRRSFEKFVNAPPVVLPQGAVGAHQVSAAHGPESRSRLAADAVSTLTGKNNVALAVGGSTIPLRSGRPRAQALSRELATVVADGSAQALATVPLVVRNFGGDDGYDRSGHAALQLGTVMTRGTQQSVAALVVPNRTNNVGRPASQALAPVMAGTVAQGVVVAAAGNTSERPNQTRGRSFNDPLFTQSTTNEFAIAALPVLRGDHCEQVHATEPIRTVSAGGTHQAVVTALFSKLNGGPDDTSWHGMDEPLNTITGRDTTGIVIVPWVEQWERNREGVTEELASITARLHETLANLQPSDEPITDEMLMSVHFRMLEPDPELRRAMAFADDYILLGNKGQMTSGLGNAVTPPVAAWITERCLATLRGLAA